VSQGCKHCYAERVFPRPYGRDERLEPGVGLRKRKFTDVALHDDRLEQPLRWKRPRRIFVNSMSDLFHEDVPDAFIDQVWAVMALSPQHTFQILTKRPERMQHYMAGLARGWFTSGVAQGPDRYVRACVTMGIKAEQRSTLHRWPLPNVWLGVSVEDQETADERIPLLLQTPAAVRFISAEPLLDGVSLARWLTPSCSLHGHLAADGKCDVCAMRGLWEGIASADTPARGVSLPRLDWVIVGGESGPKARPCDVGWVRGLVGQCKDAGVPVFVKQLGARTTGWCFGNCDSDGVDWTRNADEADACQSHEAGEGAECPDGRCCMRRDRKGGDPSEWPADLRVREFPA